MDVHDAVKKIFVKERYLGWKAQFYGLRVLVKKSHRLGIVVVRF